MAAESEAAAAFKAKILAIVDNTKDDWRWAMVNGQEIDGEQHHMVICVCESSASVSYGSTSHSLTSPIHILQVNHIMPDHYLHNVSRRAMTSPDMYVCIRDFTYHNFRSAVSKKCATAEHVQYLHPYCGFLLEFTISDWLRKQGCQWHM